MSNAQLLPYLYEISLLPNFFEFDMKHYLAASVFAFAASSVSAATIDIQRYSAAAYSALLSGGSYIAEDFESEGRAFGAAEVNPLFQTDVGTFSVIGGVGSGGTVSKLPGNTGTELALRRGNVYGRVNTTAGGAFYLDSNDTFGMNWSATTGRLFDRIVFTLSDAADTGAVLRIDADDGISPASFTTGRLRNGQRRIIDISFDAPVRSAFISLTNVQERDGRTLVNDGFAIDDVSVGLAAVPLPAGFALLLTGLGGMALARRFGRA